MICRARIDWAAVGQRESDQGYALREALWARFTVDTVRYDHSVPGVTVYEWNDTLTLGAATVTQEQDDA